MKLPTEIHGINKIRDAMILSLYAEGYSCQEIKEMRKLPISVRRVEQILYTNKALIKVDREWEETKQIHRIRNRIKKAPETKKDVYDWETLLHDKIGTKKVEHSGEIKTGETKIIIIRADENSTGKRITESMVSEEQR